MIDNYRSTDRLNYEAGPVTAIAIGVRPGTCAGMGSAPGLEGRPSWPCQLSPQDQTVPSLRSATVPGRQR